MNPLLPAHVHRPIWIYNRTICTGLGDRVGVMLTVATLGYISNVDVEVQWCTDPSLEHDNILPSIPQWKGYDYPLTEFHRMFQIPDHVKIVETYSQGGALSVSYTGNKAPAHEALDQVYTTASKTTRLLKTVTEADFIRAYHVVGSQFRPIITPVTEGAYIVVHMRAPDTNTYKLDWNPALFCTHKVLKTMLQARHNVFVISNDIPWAREALAPFDGRLTFYNSSAFQGMGLLLNALGIVQHATPGYSSYSNVPAMARGTPLISTYMGQDHRYRLFAEVGEVPPEFYTCNQRKAFIQRLASRVGLA